MIEFSHEILVLIITPVSHMHLTRIIRVKGPPNIPKLYNIKLVVPRHEERAVVNVEFMEASVYARDTLITTAKVLPVGNLALCAIGILLDDE